jgi:hypothetical protein
MTSSIRFRINSPKVVNKTIDGEVVIINLDKGNYYSLDKVGTDIWSFIERSASVSEVIEAITQRYNASGVEIENTVVQLIGELQQEELIVPNQAQVNESVKEIDTLENRPEIEKLSFEAPMLQKYADMQDLLLLDPIHEVDETGWPSKKADAAV